MIGALARFRCRSSFDADMPLTHRKIARSQRNRVFTNAPGEDQCVEPAQRSRSAPHPFPGLITEYRQASAARLSLFSFARRSRISGLVSEIPQQAGFCVNHLIKLWGGHSFTASEVGYQPGIEIARPRAHHQAPRRSKPIVVSIDRPLEHRCQCWLRLPRWARITRPFAAFCSAPFQLS